MVLQKNSISLNVVALLSFMTFSMHAFEDIKSNEEEILEVYDLCLAFEKMYKNINCFEAYITFLEGTEWARISLNLDQVCRGKALIDEVTFLKENKKVLTNLSFDELEQIKLKLKNALEELATLRKKQLHQIAVEKKSVYKEWVKVVFKLLINRTLLRYIDPESIFITPLAIIQVYYLFGFGKNTFYVLQDITERIFEKIW